MPQFFVKSTSIVHNEIIISEKEDIRHILNVLRCNINDEIILVDEEEFTYKTQISDIKKDMIVTKVVEKYESSRKLNINLTLAQSILKSSAQDFLIQKATELGVKTLIPLITKYTVVKFESNKDKEQKRQRWQRIALESCKQCERSDKPIINNILDFKDFINNLSQYDIVVVCVERETETSIKKFLKSSMPDNLKSTKILVIIGPEGGWNDAELSSFKEKGMTLLSLGNLIYRAETAAIKALSDVIYEYELQ